MGARTLVRDLRMDYGIKVPECVTKTVPFRTGYLTLFTLQAHCCQPLEGY